MAKRILAIAAIAIAAIFAVPTAAMAAGYVPPGDVSSSGGTTEVPGGTDTITFAAGSYNDDEAVSVSVTGDPAPTLGVIGTATSTYTATATGGASFKVTIPASATVGSVYSVVATGEASGNVGTYRITVVAASNSTAVSSGLAFTGGTISMLVVWGGAGLLALGLALVIVMRVVRRQRANA
jgi:hypothetical protein